MMFEIAFLENAAYTYGLDTYYHNVKHNLNMINDDVVHIPHLKHAYEYVGMFKNFDWKLDKAGSFKHTYKFPFHFQPFSTVSDNYCYDGFFQCEKYFPNRDFVLNLFEPSDLVNKELEKYKGQLDGVTCSIHVRRGDYVRLNRHHPVQSEEYFNKSIDYIGEVDRYLIFSDDHEWCKSVFKGDKFYFVEDEKDYIELFLQSKCTHNIISNSTFGWWGAWLNKNEDKKVVGPSKWFGPAKKISSADIIPKSWKVI